MPSTACCTTSGTLYKGLFIVILLLIALEYLFGSITERKNFFVYNATGTQAAAHHRDRSMAGQHSALIKTLLFRNRAASTRDGAAPAAASSTNSSSSSSSFSTNTTASAFNNTLLSNATTTASAVPSELALMMAFSTISEAISDGNSTSNGAPAMPVCPDASWNLRGRIDVVKSPVPTVQDLEARFSWLMPGGHWAPETCKVAKKVAIVIPFRCRGEHLLLFLQHMHPFLKRQQLDYTIVIVEQDGDGPFNRAMLMNVGFTEALRMRKFDCFIFHDVDLLPEDDRNMYTCPPGQPRHMSVAVDQLKYKLPYAGIFGGVGALNTEHFRLLNGFSNSYWGWGGEDDDMSNRIRYHNLFISRYPVTIARYTMLTHKKDKPSPSRYELLKHSQKRFDTDGLNSLKYKLIQSKKNLLYTWFLVRLEMPS